jgi:hypothetical protein
MSRNKLPRDQIRIVIFGELKKYDTYESITYPEVTDIHNVKHPSVTYEYHPIGMNAVYELTDSIMNYSQIIYVDPVILTAVMVFCVRNHIRIDSDLKFIIDQYIMPIIVSTNNGIQIIDRHMEHYFRHIIQNYDTIKNISINKTPVNDNDGKEGQAITLEEKKAKQQQKKLTREKTNIQNYRNEFVRYLIGYLDYLQLQSDTNSQIQINSIIEKIKAKIDSDIPIEQANEYVSLLTSSIGNSYQILNIYLQNQLFKDENDESVFPDMAALAIYYYHHGIDVSKSQIKRYLQERNDTELDDSFINNIYTEVQTLKSNMEVYQATILSTMQVFDNINANDTTAWSKNLKSYMHQLSATFWTRENLNMIKKIISGMYSNLFKNKFIDNTPEANKLFETLVDPQQIGIKLILIIFIAQKESPIFVEDYGLNVPLSSLMSESINKLGGFWNFTGFTSIYGDFATGNNVPFFHWLVATFNNMISDTERSID